MLKQDGWDDWRKRQNETVRWVSIERVNVDAELDWLGGAGNFGS